MHLTTRLVGSDDRGLISLWRHITNPFAKAAAAEAVGTAKEIDRVIWTIRCDAGFHRPVMLVAQGIDVSPHSEQSVALQQSALCLQHSADYYPARYVSPILSRRAQIAADKGGINEAPHANRKRNYRERCCYPCVGFDPRDQCESNGITQGRAG